jgi:hypothetical protein
MDTVAGDLDQLAVGNALRLQGAWPYTVKVQAKTPFIWGVGARSKGDPRTWDP